MYSQPPSPPTGEQILPESTFCSPGRQTEDQPLQFPLDYNPFLPLKNSDEAEAADEDDELQAKVTNNFGGNQQPLQVNPNNNEKENGILNEGIDPKQTGGWGWSAEKAAPETQQKKSVPVAKSDPHSPTNFEPKMSFLDRMVDTEANKSRGMV